MEKNQWNTILSNINIKYGKFGDGDKLSRRKIANWNIFFRMVIFFLSQMSFSSSGNLAGIMVWLSYQWLYLISIYLELLSGNQYFVILGLSGAITFVRIYT